MLLPDELILELQRSMAMVSTQNMVTIATTDSNRPGARTAERRGVHRQSGELGFSLLLSRKNCLEFETGTLFAVGHCVISFEASVT